MLSPIKNLQTRVQQSQSQSGFRLQRFNTNQRTQFSQQRIQNINNNNQSIITITKQQQKKQTQRRLQQQTKAYFDHLNLLFMYLKNTSFYQELKMKYNCLSSLSNQQKRNLVVTGQIVKMSQANRIVQLEVTKKKIMLIIHGDVQYRGIKFTKGQCVYSHYSNNFCFNDKYTRNQRNTHFQSFTPQKISSLKKNQSESFRKYKQEDNDELKFLNSQSAFRFKQKDKQQKVTDNPQIQLQSELINLQTQPQHYQLRKIISFKVVNKTSILALDQQQFQIYLKFYQEQYTKKCFLQKIFNPLKTQTKLSGQKINITSQMIKKLSYKMKIFQTKDTKGIINSENQYQNQAYNTAKQIFGLLLNSSDDKNKNSRYNSKFKSKRSYILLDKQNQVLTQIENTYAGQQILWSNQYQYKIMIKTNYAKYGIILKQQFLQCVGIQLVNFLKRIFERRQIQRYRIQNKLNLAIQNIKQTNKNIGKSKEKFRQKQRIHIQESSAFKFKTPKRKLTKTQPSKSKLNYTSVQLQAIKNTVETRVIQFKTHEIQYKLQRFKTVSNQSQGEKRKRWTMSQPKTQQFSYSQQKSLLNKQPIPSPRHMKHSRSKTLSYFETPKVSVMKQIEKSQISKKTSQASPERLNNHLRYEYQKKKSYISLSNVRFFDYNMNSKPSQNNFLIKFNIYNIKNKSRLLNNKKQFFNIKQSWVQLNKKAYTAR